MTAPLVGVVIPTHNRRPLLAETLASVLQERSIGIEVVVVDDGSSDDTWEWLATVDDPRVKVLRNMPARRAAAARNVGLAELTAPYTMTLDDDDLLRPGAIPTLVDALQRRPRCVGSAGTNVTFGAVSPHQPPHPRVPISMTLWREQMFGWNVQPGTSIWRTSAVRDGGGWDESLTRCEDLEFNLRLCRERVALIPRIVMQFRMHAGQVDGAVRAHDLELDRQIRDKFIAGLPPRDREAAEHIRAALEVFQVALAAYEGGEFRAASAGFTTMFRTAPYLARSPVLAPWLLGLYVKSLASIAVPAAVRPPIARLRQARRHRRLSDAAPP